MPLRSAFQSLLRPLLIAVGCLAVVLGVIGLVVPMMPGTLFLLIAAACFARSSPRLERWLMEHPRLGSTISAWRRDRSLPLVAKILATASMALSFVFTWYSGAPPEALWATAAILIACIAFVLTRPTTRR